MGWTAERYHDISCGHRVHNQGSKCEWLHGHNYRIHFTCEADSGDLDNVGRVIDFSDMKSRLCMWLENNWDHKFIAWDQDPIIAAIYHSMADMVRNDIAIKFKESIVWVPFNPTAENMAQYLVEVVGPRELEGTGIVLTNCRVDETRKCSASFKLEGF